jgi:hypothetical protein
VQQTVNKILQKLNGYSEGLLQEYQFHIARNRPGVGKLLGEKFNAKVCLLDDGGNISLMGI